MSVIPVTQEAENRRIMVQNQPRQTVRETLSQKKKHYKRGLVEWFKVQTLSSSPSTGKKKKKIFTWRAFSKSLSQKYYKDRCKHEPARLLFRAGFGGLFL
jgi:hypothetical protein